MIHVRLRYMLACLGLVAVAFAGQRAHAAVSLEVVPPTQFADVNADGQADAIVVNKDGIFIRGSSGGGFYSDFTNWTSGAFYGTHGTFFADVDGDGKADAIAVNGDAIYVRLSNGSAYPGPATKWTTGAFYGNAPKTYRTYFADVNGDGKADAIAVNTDSVYVKLSSGTAFGSSKNWTNGAYLGNYGSIYFADVSGDKKADAIVVNSDGVYVRLSNGKAFPGPASKWTSGAFYGNASPSMGDNNFFADMNADGRADAIVVNTDGIFVRGSSGNSFSSLQTNWTGTGFYGKYQGTAFADVNADGKADVLAVNTEGIWARTSTGSKFNAAVNWTGNGFYGNAMECADGNTYNANASPVCGTTVSPACGGSNQTCCMGGSCSGGYSCQSGVCKPAPACGALGQACCSSSCGSGLLCQGGTCVNGCAVSANVTVGRCYNLDGSESSYYTAGSVSAYGCGISEQAAIQNAAFSLATAGFGCLLDYPSPGCCTYVEQPYQGCYCH